MVLLNYKTWGIMVLYMLPLIWKLLQSLEMDTILNYGNYESPVWTLYQIFNNVLRLYV